MTATLRCLLMCLVAFVSALGCEAVQGEDINLPGQWTGGAYYTDSGSFDHCAASADYRNGTTLYVFVYSDFSWHLGFLNPDWSLISDTIDIQYRFDGGIWFSASASTQDRKFMNVSMPGETTLISMFRQGHTLEVAFGEGKYGFDLAQTSRLMAALADCVSNHLSHSAPSAEAAASADALPQADEPKSPAQAVHGVSGTGIIVANAGFILTNNHVIDGCASIDVTQPGDIAHEASLVSVDKQNDLALLKTNQHFSDPNVAPFRFGSGVKAGEIAAVYGFPLAGTLSESGNIVSGNITSLSGLGDDVRYFQISAPVQPGNSGGPLMDASGLVIGVVNARIDDTTIMNATGTVPQNINFAIKGSIAESFLEAHAVAYRTLTETNPKTLVDIASSARSFTVLVACP